MRHGTSLHWFGLLGAFALVATIIIPTTALANTTFAQLHSQETEALRASLGDIGPSAALRTELVLARRIAEIDFEAGKATFGGYVETINKRRQPDAWFYANTSLAEVLVRMGDLDEAQRLLAENPLPDNGSIDPSIAALVEMTGAAVEFFSVDPSMGVARFRQAREMALAADDLLLALQAMNGIGLGYMRQGLTREAIDSLSEARRELAFVPSDSSLGMVIKANLAYLYGVVGEYERALEGYEEAIKWARGHEQWARVYILAAGMGHALNRMGRYEETIKTITEISENQDISARIESSVGGLLVLATAYSKTGQHAAAMETTALAGEIIDRENDPVRSAELDVVQARVLAGMGDAETAADLLDKVIADLSQRLPSTLLQETVETAAEVQIQVGNYERALAFTQEAVALERSTRSAEHDALLGALRVDNELALKQRELDLSEQKNRANEAQKQRDIAINGLVMLLGAVALLGCYLTYARWNSERRARKTLEAEVRKRTAEVQFELQGRMDAERDKSRLEQRIAEDEKLRAIAQLTGGLSHDFNNIMTVISCSAELIRARHEGVDEEETRELVDDILAATESGAKVTGALLSYARQQPLRPQLTRLDRFFEDHYSLFKNTLGEEITLTIDAHPAVVEIDQNLLTTSILNLLFNSKDALSQGGEVVISVRKVASGDSDNRVHILVKDDGIGMDDETRDRAMEPFFTTKAGGKGSGLGLSMVYGFARQSNAALAIDSKPGEGTTVSLELEGRDGATVTEAQMAISPVKFGNEKQRARVLLVEDQEAIRRLAARALAADKIDVTVCPDATSAIEMLNSSPAFDVVVTDIVMPGSYDGHDVARCAKRLSGETEVLMTSGHAEQVPVEFDFLAKPYSVGGLVAAVDALLQTERSSKPTLN